MLRLIFIASFALTGGLFYLSKAGSPPTTARAINSSAPTDLPAEKIPMREKEPSSPSTRPAPQLAAKTTLAPKDLSYASLLPTTNEVTTISSRKQKAKDAVSEFYAEQLNPVITSCFHDLIKKRREIYEAREGDAELSFAGDVRIVVTFDQNQVQSVQSRSAEIREVSLHNCLEFGVKGLRFPESIASRGEWVLVRPMEYDVRHEYKCKQNHVMGNGGTDYVTQLGAGRCL